MAAGVADVVATVSLVATAIVMDGGTCRHVLQALLAALDSSAGRVALRTV